MSIHFIKLKKASVLVLGVFLGTFVSRLALSSNDSDPVYYPGVILETAHADITGDGAGDAGVGGGECGDGGGDCGN